MMSTVYSAVVCLQPTVASYQLTMTMTSSRLTSSLLLVLVYITTTSGGLGDEGKFDDALPFPYLYMCNLL